jgi:lipoprotein-releasing system ATP-binding protein
VLQAVDLSKQYPTANGPLAVLSEVSLSLASGDGAAIMGPSGSGKSTLLYILGGLEPPTSGTVTLDGQDLFARPPDERAALRNQSIGFVFQDHCLLPQCTLLENVLIPTLVVRNGPDEAARARELIAQVGLSGRIDHRPGELSGGERQRAAIARALIRQPRVVLCDEPTGNLDRASADRVASLLVELNRRRQVTLVVVTHSTELASRFPIRFDLVEGQLRRER